MSIIALLVSYYWRPIGLATMLISALAYRAVLVHQRDDARRKVTETTSEATALRGSNRALEQMIDQQNAAVAELKARADAAVNSMNAREEAAHRDAVAAEGVGEQQARALAPAPISAGQGCEGAIRWGNETARELAPW